MSACLLDLGHDPVAVLLVGVQGEGIGRARPSFVTNPALRTN